MGKNHASQYANFGSLREICGIRAYYNLEYLYVWILPQNHAETISKC